MAVDSTIPAGGQTLQYITLNGTASNGINHIIAAPGATQRIYVVGYRLSFSGTVNANFQNTGASPTVFDGLIYGLAGTNISAGVEAPNALFFTGLGLGLDLNLSAGTAIGGGVTYFVGP